MSWTRSGKISVTNGQVVVTGTGTNWITTAGAGEALQGPDGRYYEIANIASNTEMTLGSPYLGATQAAQDYAIMPSQSYIRDLAAQAAVLVNEFSDVVASIGTMATQDADAVDVTGGAIDGVVIGGRVPGAVHATTLSASGNAILGDASTDTVTVNGYMGVGGAGTSSQGINVVSSALTGTVQSGIFSAPIATNSATVATIGFLAQPNTAGAFTSGIVSGFYAYNANKGTGSITTNQYGVTIADQTSGISNYGVSSQVSASTIAATISNIVVTSNIVTVSTAAAHGLMIGETATVTATTNTGINGAATVLSTPSIYTFTYAKTLGNITSVADTGTVALVRNKWNIYASGTAPNYFAGNVGIGSGSAPITYFGSAYSAQRAAFGSLPNGPYVHGYMASNAYPSGSGDPNYAVWRIKSGAAGDLGGAMLHEQSSSGQYFRHAVPGIAGAAITWVTDLSINSAGSVLVGLATSSSRFHVRNAGLAQSSPLSEIDNGTAASIKAFAVNAFAASATATAIGVGKNDATNRSINAGGTVNASGADYAEYELNKGIKFVKGEIVGFAQDGTLTNIFAYAIRFGIKSTNPSYVGGDTWGSETQVGKHPEKPVYIAPTYTGAPKPEKPTAPVAPECAVNLTPTEDEAEIAATVAALADYEQLVAAHESALSDYETAYAIWQADDDKHQAQIIAAESLHAGAVAQYEIDLLIFEEKLEAERHRVDRIAYSGKVPVNVQGATPGGYIIAVPSEDGGIDGEYVADPDFAQYKKAVGRVNRILEDGRAEVAVMVH